METVSVVNISASPNRPTATTEKSSPSKRSIWPKVKRAGPAIGSRPIMLSAKPSASATKALMALRPPSTLTSDSAKHIIAVISVGPKASAAREIGTESATSPTRPNRPPMKEANTLMPSARPASPFCAIG